ncbi:Aste57867_12335 [Aphanomyces stellatus]|uniref:Aste57867_12335 protein n=1 Tax=Aphanomyces stellatus TaxID=120398 RepID=A0A485KV89_9STRA|nr:hypothetical protein As57867_012289 [Aphanomyces stellatus]VFT89187.1 Aste57867_12335 [Aphanomyces stellatus]
MATTNCFVQGCTQLALPTGKCEKHKGRTKCIVQNCPNQTYARSLCVKHGGKRLCLAVMCSANARSHGYCCKHIPAPTNTKKFSQEAGCSKVAHCRGHCVGHGGGRKCKVDGCGEFARVAGTCRVHIAVQVSEVETPDFEMTRTSDCGWSMDLTVAYDEDMWRMGESIVFSSEEITMLDYFLPPLKV